MKTSIYRRILTSVLGHWPRYSAIACLCFLTTAFQLGSGCGTPFTAPSANATLDTTFHSPLGNGNPDIVRATAMNNFGLVCVGGNFPGINGTSTEHVACYDPISQVWLRDASGMVGLNGQVNTLLFTGGANQTLIAGGAFSKYTGAPAGADVFNIAQYDFQTRSWTPLGPGLDGPVTSLAVLGNDLYVGGQFATTHDHVITGLNNIARFDLSSGGTWHALGSGLDDVVQSVAAVPTQGGTLIVAGGSFTHTFDAATTLNHIAVYDPTSGGWAALADNGLDDTVFTLLAGQSGQLYVGGHFIHPTNSALGLNHIGIYDFAGAGSWSFLPGLHVGVDADVYGLARQNHDLFIAGAFVDTSDLTVTNLNYVCDYDLSGHAWTTLNASFSAYSLLIAPGNVLYVGGAFNQISGQHSGSFASFLFTPSPIAPRVGRPTTGVTNGPSSNALAPAFGASYLPIGYTNTLGLNGTVDAVAADSNGKIYVGGQFTGTADGSTTLNHIARFDPLTRTWATLANNGLNGEVKGLAVIGSTLYAGGLFTKSGDNVTTLNHVAKYDLNATTWTSLAHNGLNGQANALAAVGNTLIAGGSFTKSGDAGVSNLNFIARYDTTTNTWSATAGNGLSFNVNGLAASGSLVYVGGFFSSTANFSVTNLNNIAKYDVTNNTWTPLANQGLDNIVNAVNVSGSQLYAKGIFDFTQDGSVAFPNFMAGYDTNSNTWTAITGTNADLTNAANTNASLIVGNEQYVGGSFSGPADYFTRIYLERWKIPASTSDWFDGNNWTTASAPAANSNAVIPTGAGTINIASADVVMQDLNVNGGTLNISPGRTLTVNGILSLEGGSITGGGTLVLTRCKPDEMVGGGVLAYVQTPMTACVNNQGAYNFPVGTANGYAPITVKNITGSGNISITPNQGAYSSPATSLPAQRLGRWWQISNPGGGVTGADVYFGYNDTDINGNEANYRVYRISGGSATIMPGAVNTVANYATATGITGFSDWTLAANQPTAAAVEVSGRVTTADGYGIRNARVTMQDQNGDVRTCITNAFGYYSFDDVKIGDAYIMSASARRYSFAPRLVQVFDTVSEVDFTPQQ